MSLHGDASRSVVGRLGGGGAHSGHGRTLVLLLVSLGSRWLLDPEPFLCAVSSSLRRKRVMQGRCAAALRSQASPGAHPALLQGRRRAPGGPRLPCSSASPGEIAVHCPCHCLLPDHHQLTCVRPPTTRLYQTTDNSPVRPPTTRLCQATDSSPVSGHRLLACVRPLITHLSGHRLLSCIRPLTAHLCQATDYSPVSDHQLLTCIRSLVTHLYQTTDNLPLQTTDNSPVSDHG